MVRESSSRTIYKSIYQVTVRIFVQCSKFRTWLSFRHTKYINTIVFGVGRDNEMTQLLMGFMENKTFVNYPFLLEKRLFERLLYKIRLYCSADVIFELYGKLSVLGDDEKSLLLDSATTSALMEIIYGLNMYELISNNYKAIFDIDGFDIDDVYECVIEDIKSFIKESLEDEQSLLFKINAINRITDNYIDEFVYSLSIRDEVDNYFEAKNNYEWQKEDKSIDGDENSVKNMFKALII